MSLNVNDKSICPNQLHSKYDGNNCQQTCLFAENQIIYIRQADTNMSSGDHITPRVIMWDREMYPINTIEQVWKKLFVGDHLLPLLNRLHGQKVIEGPMIWTNWQMKSNIANYMYIDGSVKTQSAYCNFLGLLHSTKRILGLHFLQNIPNHKKEQFFLWHKCYIG